MHGVMRLHVTSACAALAPGKIASMAAPKAAAPASRRLLLEAAAWQRTTLARRT